MTDSPDTEISTEQILRFLWQGYPDDALFETRTSPSRISYHRLDEAIDQLGTAKFFGLVPRRRRGSTKGDVWPGSHLIWTDVDSFRGSEEKGVTINQTNWLIEHQLKPHGLRPAYVQRAHGAWLVFSCSDLIPKELAEQLNRALAEVCFGDRAARDIGRICRVPGTIHNGDKANPVPVMHIDLDQTAIYSLDELKAALSDKLKSRPNKKQRPGRGGSSRAGNPTDRILWLPFKRPAWTDKRELKRYLTDPTYARAQRGKRSDIEHQIVCVLLGSGFNRAQVHFFFDNELPSKYEEESRKGNGTRWLNRSVNQVFDESEDQWLQEALAINPTDPFLLFFQDKRDQGLREDQIPQTIKDDKRFNKNTKETLSPSYPCKEHVLVRTPRRQVDRLQLVKAIGLGKKARQSEFVKDQAKRFGVDQKTIKRNLDPMIATGLIVKEDDPTSGRHKLLSLDPEKGDRIVNHKGFWFVRDVNLLGERWTLNASG